TATAIVLVSPSVIANDDAGTGSAGASGVAIGSLVANDVVNGLPATLGATGNAVVSAVGTYPAGITLDANTGSVSVAIGTVPGTYTLVYQLCDKLSPVTCTTANAVVTVAPSVIAMDDAGLASAGTGGTAIPNVTGNDIVNGVSVLLGVNAEVSTVGTYPAGITLNTTTGSISVATGTVPGTYTLVYQLCDKLAAPTCT
ncbi:putative Ig domain-containing protein, partial [Fibrivirga algicola]